MIDQSQAEYLLNLPKFLTEDGNYLERKDYMIPLFPLNDRLFMASKEEMDFTFFLEMFQSRRQHLRLSLHFQEAGTSIGLLRVDFNSRHRNPSKINEHVPEALKPYAGKWIDDSHIHFFVEGYKPLVWALPLKRQERFPLKQFGDESELGNIITAFCSMVHLQTALNISVQTRME